MTGVPVDLLVISDNPVNTLYTAHRNVFKLPVVHNGRLPDSGTPKAARQVEEMKKQPTANCYFHAQ